MTPNNELEIGASFEVIGYLRALKYLAPRLASDWEAVKRMENEHA